MQQANTQNRRVRRTVDELVIAEMFLIQATLESAVAIGSGVSALGRRISNDSDDSEESVQTVLQRIRTEAVEPYASRYQYFREMVSSNK